MNKGFVFSIEAVFVFLLLITSVFIFNYDNEDFSKFSPLIENQSQKITGFYFGEDYENKEADNKYCGKIINYRSRFEIKDFCEDYNE
jgi:hypothetical protein